MGSEISVAMKHAGMLGLRDAAGFLGRSPGTVYHYVSDGKIPVYKYGNTLLFRIQDLEEFLKPRPRKPRRTK